jgi:MoaA/NifB/PqqE/SkfB family radical SAM enzyme
MERFDFNKKIFLHPGKINRLKKGKRPFPLTVEIDLTDSCNHKCKFCFTPKLDKSLRSSLKYSVLKNTLVELWSLGTRGISLTGGGESMLHPDFDLIAKKAKEIGFDLGLMTNGSLMIGNKVNVILDNFQWVRVSMSGGVSEIYNRVQGVNHFDLVVKNLKRLVMEKETRGKDLVIGVRMLINRINIDSAINMVETFRDTNLDYIQFASSQFDKKDIVKGRKFKRILKEIEKIRNKKTKIQTSGYAIEQDKNYPKHCYAHFFQGAINAKGELLFCKNCRDSNKYRLGNINEQCLHDIWSKNSTRKLEEQLCPANCGLFCKNSKLNETIEEIFTDDKSIQPNFIN